MSRSNWQLLKLAFPAFISRKAKVEDTPRISTTQLSPEDVTVVTPNGTFYLESPPAPASLVYLVDRKMPKIISKTFLADGRLSSIVANNLLLEPGESYYLEDEDYIPSPPPSAGEIYYQHLPNLVGSRTQDPLNARLPSNCLSLCKGKAVLCDPPMDVIPETLSEMGYIESSDDGSIFYKPNFSVKRAGKNIRCQDLF